MVFILRPDGLLRILALALLAAAAAPAVAQPIAKPSFMLELRAPPAVRPLLERHLELQRYRQVSDLDDAELTRLLRLAERDARELLATQGYFAPRLEIRREAGAEGVPRVVVDVQPGELATVAGVDIAFEGDIRDSTDPAAQRQRREIRERWSLPPGRPFTQDAWNDAKAGALRELVARRYPAGQVSYSLADVDAATSRARLGIRLDSGPPFRLGELRVTGLQRYDPVLVPRLARLARGSLYDQDEIQKAQLRLAGSGYFDSAFIFVDPASDPAAAPVQVNVREAPLHRVVLGLGLSTDTGPRASVEYTHNQLPVLGWRAVTKLQLDRKAPFASTELTAIPGEDGWRWGVAARAERLDDGTLVTHAQQLRIGRSRLGDHIDRNVYVQYDRATVRAQPGTPAELTDIGDGTALSANYIWNGRYFDRTPYPTSGFAVGAEVGGGVTLTGSRSPFQRTVLRWSGIRPLEQGRLQLRAEGGAVLARESARVPSSQLFRTGGDTSVRGYGYRDIGLERPGGVVVPGRYLAVGSVEWQRPIRRAGVATAWESAVFVDAGAVADDPGDLRPTWGAGVGARYRSPLGPLQADLAYGFKAKRLRLHVSLATAF
ncbi:MAG TPA: BamA/TamA family outer membrane protein [Ramlibacter sp.]|nr:BamA/TamA family outer membrane protein [Ramlibacter sp.]